VPLSTVILINRPPLEFDGDRVRHSQAGGAARPMVELAGWTGATIVSLVQSASHLALKQLAESNGGVVVPESDQPVRMRLVDVDDQPRQDFLSRFVNPHIWFERHRLHRTVPDPEELWGLVHGRGPDDPGSVTVVTEALARAAVEEALAERDGVRPDHVLALIDDYQLERCNTRVRALLEERRVGVTIQHFSHIPMQEPRPVDAQVFPEWLRREQLEAMLAADNLQFHSIRFVDRFLSQVERELSPSRYRVDRDRGEVAVLGPDGSPLRRVVVQINHINPDLQRMRRLAADSETRLRALRPTLPPGVRRYMLNVGRTDPSKNHPRLYAAATRLWERHPEHGFIPYGRILADHPQLLGLDAAERERRYPDLGDLSLGEVRRRYPDVPILDFEDLVEAEPRLESPVPLLSFVQPSRLDVPEYRDNLDEMARARDAGNSRFALPGRPERVPIIERQAQDEREMAAWESGAAVIATVSVEDGYALVWREAIEANRSGIAAVVSNRIGSYDDEVRNLVVGVDPYDTDSIASGLETALNMPESEVAARARALKVYNQQNQVGDWVEARVLGVNEVLPPDVELRLRRSPAPQTPAWEEVRRARFRRSPGDPGPETPDAGPEVSR
jgi:trehalose-6-phosphate synthase